MVKATGEPLVYIILVNYKNWQDTAECLESLFKLSYHNYKVVVVDNDSKNNSITYLKNWAEGLLSVSYDEQFYTSTPISSSPISKPISYLHADSESIHTLNSIEKRLLLIESKKNLGFAGGNNLGSKLALAHNADYIWLLNNDTVVEQESLTHMVARFEVSKSKKEQLGMLGSKLLYYHTPNLIQAILGRYKPFTASTEHIGLNKASCTTFDNLKIEDDDYVVGASMFVSAEFVKEVGLMSEAYFLYFEEIDWVKRGAAKNFKIDICLKANIYHKEGAAIGGSTKENNNKSELSDFYSIRNRLIITKKYYPRFLYPVYLSLIAVAANRVRRKQFSRIPLILKAFKSFKKNTLWKAQID